MAVAETPSDPARNGAGLDVRTAIEISKTGLFDRMAFAAVFAVVSIAVLPWLVPVAWITAIAVWEWGIGPRLDAMVTKLPQHRAVTPYAAINLPGSAIYEALALACLANGSALGVAIGVTWIAGAILNCFVYASANRQLLLATLLPPAVFAVAGPFIAYGLDWRSVIIPVLLGLSGLASQRFSLDHGAVLRQLADRQMAFADMERKLSIAIDAAGDGQFEVDLIAETMAVSPNWLSMLGYAPDEFDGGATSWRRFVHPDDIDRVLESNLAHYRGETPYASAEIRMICKDGSLKWVLSRAGLVSRTADGAPRRMVGTTIDILCAQGAGARSGDGARRGGSRQPRQERVPGQHEPRDPHAAERRDRRGRRACGAPTSTTRQAEMVSVIEDSAESLQVLLADILDLARVEAGRLEINPEPFDLRSTVDRSGRALPGQGRGEGPAAQRAGDGRGRQRLLGDRVRIKQIVGNLLSNAVKFTERAASVTLTGASRAAAGRRPSGALRGERHRHRLRRDGARSACSAASSRRTGRSPAASAARALACRSPTPWPSSWAGRSRRESRPGEGATFVLSLPLSRPKRREDASRRAPAPASRALRPKRRCASWPPRTTK